MAKMSRLVQLVLILFCLLGHSLGVHVFDVYRLMQIDKLGVSLGSRKTSLNLLATTNISTPSRHVLVVPSKNVTVDLIKNLAEKKIDGMLVLLPNSSVTEDNEWNKVERYLQEVNFECPIYFTHLTESVSQMYEYLLKDEVQQESLLGGDSWRLVVSSAEAYALPKFQFRNYQGWIVGSTPNDAENIPTIAVVANIDSFSVVPGLSKGTDSNGSGVTALFELARLFSKLYSNPRTHGHYNILFLLTNTGRMNYESTKFWLENTESRILDNIEFVLSLDTIGVKDSLNLHVSRSPDKSQFIKLVYDSFSNVSKYHGVEHEIIRKKINISSSYVPWQHEQFARKKLFAATVSTSKDPFHESLRSNIFDNPERINVTNFKRNIEIVAEFLAKIIYNIEDDVKIFRDDLAVDEKYILSTLNTVSEFNRMMPYLVVDNDKKPILDGFENELSKFVGDLVVQKGEITSENIYYDKLKLEMSAYRAKPLIFDVLLTLAIVVYVGILYVAIKGTGDSWEELVKLFSRQKK